ncbi:HEAT repeat domain-containing protein [Caloranaerobacter sp. DY30410]|uniref:HEAT repeat domain-containing protein n=1 Tax=Caloranaerobacter sp. DY30410 TaxID=3238305 RepID=UPI003D04A34A
MKKTELSWSNIKKLKDYHITYLLYLEGRNIDEISIIRRMPKEQVERHILECKISLSKKTSEEDLLIKIISLNKKDRLEYLSKVNESERETLVMEIYKRYIKFKNPEDRMILIWLIGEIKDKRLLPFIRMELRSKYVNLRRLCCSALGKIKDEKTKDWLEEALEDANPQVRQYAAKALKYVGDLDTINKLRKIIADEKEKGYVKKAAYNSLVSIEAKLAN